MDTEQGRHRGRWRRGKHLEGRFWGRSERTESAAQRTKGSSQCHHKSIYCAKPLSLIRRVQRPRGTCVHGCRGEKAGRADGRSPVWESRRVVEIVIWRRQLDLPGALPHRCLFWLLVLRHTLTQQHSWLAWHRRSSISTSGDACLHLNHAQALHRLQLSPSIVPLRVSCADKRSMHSPLAQARSRNTERLTK